MQKVIDLFLNIYSETKNKYNFSKMWGKCVDINFMNSLFEMAELKSH